MRHVAFAAVLLCGAVSFSQPVSAARSDGVSIPAVIPYAQDAPIAGAVKRECQLGEKLSTFIKEAAQAKGIAVNQVSQIDRHSAGRVLVLEIKDAQADGNAFLGHHTFTTVNGKLYEEGREIGSFVGRRNSMGGAFGGFKGNCSVLGRTVKSLGEDIAGWLSHPDEGGMLGDLK